jgi:hypothetical protein
MLLKIIKIRYSFDDPTGQGGLLSGISHAKAEAPDGRILSLLDEWEFLNPGLTSIGIARETKISTRVGILSGFDLAYDIYAIMYNKKVEQDLNRIENMKREIREVAGQDESMSNFIEDILRLERMQPRGDNEDNVREIYDRFLEIRFPNILAGLERMDSGERARTMARAGENKTQLMPLIEDLIDMPELELQTPPSSTSSMIASHSSRDNEEGHGNQSQGATEWGVYGQDPGGGKQQPSRDRRNRGTPY